MKRLGTKHRTEKNGTAGEQMWRKSKTNGKNKEVKHIKKRRGIEREKTNMTKDKELPKKERTKIKRGVGIETMSEREG